VFLVDESDSNNEEEGEEDDKNYESGLKPGSAVSPQTTTQKLL